MEELNFEIIGFSATEELDFIDFDIDTSYDVVTDRLQHGETLTDIFESME